VASRQTFVSQSGMDLGETPSKKDPLIAAGTLPQTALIIDASSISTSNSLEQGTRRLEKTREKLATWLIVIFAITISVSFVVLPLLVLSVYFSFKPGNSNQNSTLDKELVIVVNPIKEFMVLVLTIESTLLGAALGFYFGEKSGIKK
jgi:heme/copper-type cytochrome/quinol oxidase subunit 2